MVPAVDGHPMMIPAAMVFAFAWGTPGEKTEFCHGGISPENNQEKIIKKTTALEKNRFFFLAGNEIFIFIIIFPCSFLFIKSVH
jgi:hypothetical protein